VAVTASKINIPAVPTLLNIPAVPTLLNIPAVPTLLNIPAVPTLLNIPAVPTLLNIPAVPTLLNTFQRTAVFIYTKQRKELTKDWFNNFNRQIFAMKTRSV